MPACDQPHEERSGSLDLANTNNGDRLAVTILATAVLTTTLLEDDDLRKAVLRDDRGCHGGASNQRSADGRTSFTATARTSENVMVEPASASSFSILSTLFGVTRYCLPPVRITANIMKLVSFRSIDISRRFHAGDQSSRFFSLTAVAQSAPPYGGGEGLLRGRRVFRQPKTDRDAIPLLCLMKTLPKSSLRALQGVTERCQSGRLGRSRKPLCLMGTVGSNPTFSAS